MLQKGIWSISKRIFESGMNGGYQAFMVFKGFNFALKIQIITNKYFLRNKKHSYLLFLQQ